MVKEQNVFTAWTKGLQTILRQGEKYKDVRSRECTELLNMKIVVEHPENDVIAPIRYLQKNSSWVYPSIQEIAEVMLTKQKYPFYEYVYGHRLFAEHGDQINDFIIPLLKERPATRKATVVLGDVDKDMDLLNTNTPGMITIDFKLREGKLHISAFIRSNDMFIGWPANVYQLFVLQEYVAGKLGVKQGSITTFSASAHIFQDYRDVLKQLLK